MTPLLLSSATDVDFNENIKGRQTFGPLIVKPFSDTQTINAVDPIETFGHRAGFIGLKWSDEVPHKLAFRMVFFEPVDLGTSFLGIVFAENALSSQSCRQYGLGRKRLGNSHKFNRTLRSCTNLRQRPLDQCQSFCNFLISLRHFSFQTSVCAHPRPSAAQCLQA